MPYEPGRLREIALKALVPRVAAVGEALAAEMRQKVSTPGPPASKEGQPPHVSRRKGPHLRDNIASHPVQDGPYVYADVGTKLPQGRFTDQGTGRMAARPWCLATLKENRDAVRGRLGGGGGA